MKICPRHLLLPSCALALVLGACSSDPASGTKNNNTTKDGGAPPGTTEDAAAGEGPLELPFLLSDEFAPSGYMGDSETDFTAVHMSKDATDCKSPRSADAAGDCYTVDWKPIMLPNQTSAWVGVYWQYPANNWGAKTGRSIASGAQTVSFYAAGAKGGEVLKFQVGGMNTLPGGDPALTNKDSFTATADVTLTTEWARYEVPLKDANYDSVIGGFAWTATVSSDAEVKFYVDDVRWQK
jgi:hypothetical protein